eukprot:677195-Hanusia_phi.AAC.1
MVLIDFDAEDSGDNDNGGEESSFPSDDEEHSMNEDGDVNEELSRRRTQMLESMNYDSNLPAAHTYLGERSTAYGDVIGICKEGDVLDVPVVRASRIIMFPGQSVPMMESNLRLVQTLRRILSDPNERKLVFVNEATAQKVWNLEDPAGSIGTTAEIRSYCHTPEALNIVLEGRQRVRVKKVAVVENVLRAIVEVLDLNFSPPPVFLLLPCLLSCSPTLLLRSSPPLLSSSPSVLLSPPPLLLSSPPRLLLPLLLSLPPCCLLSI